MNAENKDQLEIDFTRPAARSTDPITSHLAAASLDPTDLEIRIMEVISSYGAQGCISEEIVASIPEYGYGSITPRYRALMRKKLIRENGSRKASSGRAQRIMVSTEYPLV